MRKRLLIMSTTVALAVVGLAPAASATCTDDPTGNFQCLETVLCAPGAVLNKLGFDVHCID